MQNDYGFNKESTTTGSNQCGNSLSPELDLEKQDNPKILPQHRSDGSPSKNSTLEPDPTILTIVVSNAEAHADPAKKELPSVDSPKKGYLSRSASSHEQCRYSL